MTKQEKRLLLHKKKKPLYLIAQKEWKTVSVIASWKCQTNNIWFIAYPRGRENVSGGNNQPQENEDILCSGRIYRVPPIFPISVTNNYTTVLLTSIYIFFFSSAKAGHCQRQKLRH